MPPLVRRTDTLGVALAMVAAGGGFSLIPDTRILRTSAGDHVRLIPVEGECPPVQVVVVWSKRGNLSPTVTAVRDLFVQNGGGLIHQYQPAASNR